MDGVYYTTEEYMRLRFERFGRGHAYNARTAEEHELWYALTAERLADIIGLTRSIPVRSDPQLTAERRYDGFTRQRWLLETEPTVFMPFYLLVPDEPNGAAIINPHGHGGAKDECLGFLPDGALSDPVSFGVSLARRGYHVAAPDARGAGERREGSHRGEGRERENSHREMLGVSVCLGISPLGGMVWDLMRLFDFLAALSTVDEKRIGCAGMSGGGMQTIYFAALDRRVSLAITSGYFYGFRDALLLQPGNCGCNYAPYLYETVDMGDLGAMIAPRPLFIESGTADKLNGASGIENVRSQVEIARQAYNVLGFPDRIVHSVHPGGHVWIGDGMAEFIKKHL